MSSAWCDLFSFFRILHTDIIKTRKKVWPNKGNHISFLIDEKWLFHFDHNQVRSQVKMAYP